MMNVFHEHIAVDKETYGVDRPYTQVSIYRSFYV